MDSSQWLKEIRSARSFQDAQRGLFQLLDNIVTQTNQGFTQLGVDTTGKISPPPPLEALNVTANNGTVHAILTHNAPISKHVRYFVEGSTDPTFSQPHVFDLGTSRSLFTSLPNKNHDGDVTPWHFRAYAQYNGSDATEKTYFGDAINPTAVTVGGTAQFTPFSSTGSGTAAPNGQQAGTGLGPVQIRAEVGPKRSPAP